jgi:hypothetical protein
MQTDGTVSLSRVAGAIVGAGTWAWGVGAKWWWRLEAPVRGPRVSGQGCFRRGGRAGSATPPVFFFGPGPVTAAFPRRGRPCPARPSRVGAIVGATGNEELGGGAMACITGPRRSPNASLHLAQHRRSRPRALFLHRPGWGVTQQQASSDAAPLRRGPAGASDRRHPDGLRGLAELRRIARKFRFPGRQGRSRSALTFGSRAGESVQ